MDIEMPVIDGFMAYKMLVEYWKECKLERVPTYALTSHNADDIKEKVLSSGMTGCCKYII